MAGETMNGTLGLLLLILLGAGLATTGLLLLLSRQPAARTPLAGLTLLLLGIGLGIGTWQLGERHEPLPAADINRLLQQAPSAAGPATGPRFRHLAILVTATPSDSNIAEASERQAYASELAGHLAVAVRDARIGTRVEGQAMPSEEWPGTENLRRCRDRDLLVLINMPAVRLQGRDEYALWREPEVELHWCGSGQRESYRFRVLERQGDSLPYEQALRSRLLELLRNAHAAS
jgi:hypothetical protein